MPYNTEGLPNASLVPNDPTLFLAGDFRANEQVGLTAMHTLFVREHNRLADLAAQTFPSSSDEQRYQMARGVVIAELQRISFDEFVPVLLGRSLPAYGGYSSSVNAQIDNAFATASYRFGHSMLSPSLLLATTHGNSALPLASSIFNPEPIETAGIDPLLRGLALQKAQRVDPFIVDGVRNFLFGPGAGLDLASLNIQRGRDHGIASYNELREAYGLPRVGSLSSISSDPVVRQRLMDTYETADDVDAWVGGLAEDHVSNGLVGPLVAAVLKDQFVRVRDGDRFYYEAYLPPSAIDWVKRQRLSDIIRRNTSIGGEIGDDVFKVK
jgi:hypothetical protein